MIKFDSISYSYSEDSKAVIKDLSLEIAKGESLAVMGLNGSGKSTLARLAAGLIEPTRGYLRIKSDNSHPVGIIFQNPDNQMVAVTVEKELAFALENKGVAMDEMEKAITSILNEFDLTDLRNRITSELSGGEKQRVALASVMILKPEILILDEPDSFLDRPGKEALSEELKRLKIEMPDMIQIHITQYPQVAAGYDRMVMLNEGQLVADGKPAEIFGNDELCRKAGLVLFQPDISWSQIGLDYFREKKVVQIIADKVEFSYPEQTSVIKNFSCRLKRGEIVGLVGLSGSGKSSLAALLCSLMKPQKGSIDYYQHDGCNIPDEQIPGQVAAIFQQPERQFFLGSCHEEIQFGPQNMGNKLDQATFEKMMKLVGLNPEEFAERDPFTLSGGEKRRLAFAAVLAINPDFIIFDEPTCGLDWQGVEMFIRLAENLKASKKGLVVISHDGNIIKRLTEKVISLGLDGRYSQVTTEEFFKNSQLSNMVSSPYDI